MQGYINITLTTYHYCEFIVPGSRIIESPLCFQLNLFFFLRFSLM